MDIRKAIRKIISEMFENEEFGTELAQKTSNAKRALIALASNRVPSRDVRLWGSLSGADFDESGLTGSSGEVEVDWTFEGADYSFSCDVETSFYYTKGSSGRWGSSVDDSEAPEPDDVDDIEVDLLEDRLKVYDDEGEDFTFSINELGNNVGRGIQDLLRRSYDPVEEQISSRK